MSWQEYFIRYSILFTVLSVAAFLAGLVAMRYAVIYMPADYFTRRDHQDDWWFDQHPAVCWSLLILKNLVGIVFLIVGFVMLAIPGPGVLMLLLGLSLVNVPGKRRMERWLVSFPAVHRKINQMRIKHRQPPLQPPSAKEMDQRHSP